MEVLGSSACTLLRTHIKKVINWNCKISCKMDPTSFPFAEFTISTEGGTILTAYCSVTNINYKKEGITFAFVRKTASNRTIRTDVGGIPFLTEIIRRVLDQESSKDVHEETMKPGLCCCKKP